MVGLWCVFFLLLVAGVVGGAGDRSAQLGGRDELCLGCSTPVSMSCSNGAGVASCLFAL